MILPREVSGVYFRYKNPESQSWENWCFEDLPATFQYEIMEKRELEWVRSLAETMLTVTHEILGLLPGDDITRSIVQKDKENLKSQTGIHTIKYLCVFLCE